LNQVHTPIKKIQIEKRCEENHEKRNGATTRRSNKCKIYKIKT